MNAPYISHLYMTFCDLFAKKKSQGPSYGVEQHGCCAKLLVLLYTFAVTASVTRISSCDQA